jgi:peptidoglycan/xylan/chitin deacetylase (PgdA/CDA1 family)
MFLLITIGAAITALAHMWPAPFVLDWMAGDGAVWSMPRTETPTIYLTFDDGPNPSTTPDLLDVLAGEGVRATFFIIDEHLNEQTAPIVRRAFAEGHAVALHSSTRHLMVMTPAQLGRLLNAAAARTERLAGAAPCRAFRPHAGWRSGQMYDGLREIDYRLIGFGWMLWDFNWFRARSAESSFRRIVSRVSDGDIIVMHDGDESAPTRDQRHTVDATRRLIPELRARGFSFGTICPTSPLAQGLPAPQMTS